MLIDSAITIRQKAFFYEQFKLEKISFSRCPVELLTLDLDRLDTKGIYENLYNRLVIAYHSVPASDDEEKSGYWLVYCFKLSKNEILKTNVSVVVRELVTSLFHACH